MDKAFAPAEGGCASLKASDSLIIYESAKHVLGLVLRGCRLSEEHFRALLRVGETSTNGRYIDYKKFLNVFKGRYLTKDAFPKGFGGVKAFSASQDTRPASLKSNLL